jgi:hypothetical protein
MEPETIPDTTPVAEVTTPAVVDTDPTIMATFIAASFAVYSSILMQCYK